ncbi:MAG: hypothetical protein ACLP2Y_10425 [Limisphaerales bacterium]
MKTIQKTKQKVFEIGFKGYLRESSEWYSEHIKARNEGAALQKFACTHKIKTPKGETPEIKEWWDNDWLMKFQYIKLVNVIECPHCFGKGVIAVN